jgi:hypothetical protein
VVGVRDGAGVPLAVPTVSARIAENVAGSSGDGARILFRSIDDRELVVRDASNLGGEVARISTAALPDAPGPTVFTIDRTGERVAGTVSTGRAVVWSVAEGTPVALISSGDVQPTAGVDVLGLALSPSGDELAVRTVDQRLEVFDVATGQARVTRQVPFDALGRVAYSPDGSVIAVDGTYLFDATTLHRLGPRFRPASWTSPVLDAGTGATTFATGAGGAVYLVVERTDQTSAVRWRVDVSGLRSRSCTVAGRNLTAAEASLYGVAPPPHETCPGLG